MKLGLPQPIEEMNQAKRSDEREEESLKRAQERNGNSDSDVITLEIHDVHNPSAAAQKISK